MIEASHLSKRYGQTLAVNDLSFVVGSGQVTGFLGPNGSGKSTTMRMIVGLDAPSSGAVTVDGQPYGQLRFPLRRVGALLDANAIHPGRSARSHLTWLADSNAIPRRRVDEVLSIVGLSDAAHRRAGQFSLGMGQRLGIAGALLGDPDVLIFDEPINGLDPEGILWVRHLLRSLADEGRTVLVSSHLMSEMALTADHLLIIGRGTMLAAGPVAELVERSSGHHVRVLTPAPEILGDILRAKGATVVTDGPEGLSVTGLEARDVGIIAAAADVTLYELSTQRASLEEAFMELTRDHAEFRAGEPVPS
ncbi:ATP-binding cassette domain-containing protein [Acidothermaceae bacterium B102]|nr:ATP-binding cassette domain-containing protein [Acidothermaceae bacterium B102]